MDKKFFENLPIRRRALTTDAPKTYRVYKDMTNFTVASGKTVTEALKASGIENAYRVVLHDIMDETVLVDGDLGEQKEKAAPAAPVEAEIPAAEASVEAVAEEPVAAPEEPAPAVPEKQAS